MYSISSHNKVLNTASFLFLFRRFREAWLIGRLSFTTANTSHDISSHHCESRAYINIILSRSFNIRNTSALSKFRSSSFINYTAINKIDFVTDEKLINIIASITVDFRKPLFNIIKCFSFSAIKNKNNALCTAIIRRSNSSETLLTSSIPLKMRGEIILIKD